MSIGEQIELIVKDLTDNNIPSQLVTITKAYDDKTCDISTNTGTIRNVRCSGLGKIGDEALLVYEEGNSAKPFVLLFADGGGGGDLSNYYTKTQINEILSSYVTSSYLDTNYARIQHTHSEYVTQSNFITLSNTVANKVDKITGKGLSEADFTSTEKTKLANIENGANKTIVDSSLSSTSLNPVQNQAINTALNGKADINHNHTIANVTDLQSSLDGKVDKVTGKGLSTNDYTSSEKDKLANIEAQANRTIVDSALDSSSTNPVRNSAITQAFNNLHIKVVSELPTPSQSYANDVFISTDNWTGGLYVCKYIPKENGEILGYGEWEWRRLDQAITFDAIYPVGAIYMSVNSTSPATLFGGEWEQLTETFLYASTTADTNSTTATAGSKDAVVVSHSHTFTEGGNALGMNTTSASTTSGFTSGNLFNNVNKRITAIASEGESGTGKNMPPYMKVYMWKRTG